MIQRRTIAIGLLAFPLLAASAWADTLIFDRGLPTININNAAGADRSNVAWGFTGNQYFSGDDFTLAGSPGVSQYLINTVRIWTADGADSRFDFSSTYNSLQLYAGAAGSGVSLLESGAFTGGTTLSNPNISITPVTYTGGMDYQGNSNHYQLWQVEFTNLNWVVNANELTQFGVFGMTASAGDFWVNHASNAARSGSTQQGSDDRYLAFDSTDLGGTPFVIDSAVDGWDKSSDVNVQLFGSAVPEPGSMLLFGTVLGALGFAIRRKRA